MVLKRLYAAQGSDGKHYEVHVYAETVHEAENGNATAIEHLSAICTSTGQSLKVLGHGRYEIEETGVILTSHDHEAI